MKSTSTDVLIVGAGPAGLSLGLCLARRGVRSIVLERRAGEIDHPRAHYVNTRTMELFRLWGVRDAVLADAYPAEHLPFGMLTQLGGPSAEELRRFSPAAATSCAQDRVESALLAALSSYPECTVRWGRTFLGAADNGAEVTAVLAGPTGQERITARWLVGADGAGSTVRSRLGVEMIGDPDLGSLINIYFEGRLDPDGTVPSLAGGSADPDVPGAFISMDGDRRWCFHYRYDPAKESLADFSPERCLEMVRRAADVGPEVPLTVRSVRSWTMTALVAERMAGGSVFLVGDAAHAFPPTGGFGMNSGIQDAHNLAWKLALMLDGGGGGLLLDSYEAERLPVAYLNTAQSLRNSSGTGSWDMSRAPSPQAALIDSRATRSVRSVAALAPTEEDRQRLELLEHAGAIGQDLGFAYDDSPVIVSDGRARPDIQIARYIPNASPGARAPHVPLRSTDGATLSALDLFDGVFTLVTVGGGSTWRSAADKLPSRMAPRSLVLAPGEDYAPVDTDVADLYGIGPDGAVLVRPDGHVAFRAASAPPDPVAELAAAIAVAHGLSPAHAD